MSLFLRQCSNPAPHDAHTFYTSAESYGMAGNVSWDCPGVPYETTRYEGTPACRICGATDNPTRHHLIPKRVVKDWQTFRPSLMKRRPKREDVLHRCNIVRLCVKHHQMVEGGQMREVLGRLLTPNERKHVERVAGREWLDANYPARP